MESYDKLFSSSLCSVEADYLRFLAARVPEDVARQINGDSVPDLEASKLIGIDDVVRPLTSFSFPVHELFEFAAVLGYTVIIYDNARKTDPTADDPYKVIYAISLYLHSQLRGPGPEAVGCLSPFGLLADITISLDLETRLQVARFLGSLVPTIRAEADHWFEPAPLSGALIALSIILGSLINDISLAAEKAMKEERIGPAWADGEREKVTSTSSGIRALRKQAAELYGVSGKIRQVPDRFLPVIEFPPEDEVELKRSSG